MLWRGGRHSTDSHVSPPGAFDHPLAFSIPQCDPCGLSRFVFLSLSLSSFSYLSLMQQADNIFKKPHLAGCAGFISFLSFNFCCVQTAACSQKVLAVKVVWMPAFSTSVRPGMQLSSTVQRDLWASSCSSKMSSSHPRPLLSFFFPSFDFV